MKLVVGGAYQGKKAYVTEHFGIPASEIVTPNAVIQEEGNTQMEKLWKNLMDKSTHICCVSDFQLIVKYALENDKDIFQFIDSMLAAHPDMIVVTDEIGNGIIPLEKKERLYRETAGRAGCRLADCAECVIRVVCGIGTVIKGNEDAV